MKVFVSATSKDLGSIRHLVKEGLLTMGYLPVEQTNFPPDYREVREMLEDKINDCEAVIHIVGMRYGAESDPAELPEGEPRQSYTQLEADIARTLGKKLYVFLCLEAFPYDQADAEPDKLRQLQQQYREKIAGSKRIYTSVSTPEDLSKKVRELQLELAQLKRDVARDRRQQALLLAALILVLAVLSGGVWWWIAKGPGATAEAVIAAQSYDPERVRAQILSGINQEADKRIAALDPAEDWRQIEQIRTSRDQQIADVDRLLEQIQSAYDEGEVSESYAQALQILEKKGVEEALDFLDSTRDRRQELIAEQKSRAESERDALREMLRENLFEASLLESQFEFEKAEKLLRETVESDDAWWVSRNSLAILLIQRGGVVEPEVGNQKLREAQSLLSTTLSWLEREKSPEAWAATQNSFGYVLIELGTRTGDAKGIQYLKQAETALRSALEVRTRENMPQNWASTQNNLGAVLYSLGSRTRGAEGMEHLKQAQTALRSALELRTRENLPQDWAGTQNNLGNVLQELGSQVRGAKGIENLKQAEIAFYSALEVFTREDLSHAWATTRDSFGLVFLTLAEETSGDEADAYLDKAYDNAKQLAAPEFSRERGAVFLAVCSSRSVSQLHYEDAIKWSREAVAAIESLDSDPESEMQKNHLWFKSTLASGLLLDGQREEALAILRENWDKPSGVGPTFGEVILADLNTFEDAGITHPDFDIIREEFPVSIASPVPHIPDDEL